MEKFYVFTPDQSDEEVMLAIKDFIIDFVYENVRPARINKSEKVSGTLYLVNTNKEKLAGVICSVSFDPSEMGENYSKWYTGWRFELSAVDYIQGSNIAFGGEYDHYVSDPMVFNSPEQVAENAIESYLEMGIDALVESLLEDVEEASKSFLRSNSRKGNRFAGKKSPFADISLLEDWRDTAQELLPKLEKMQGEIKKAIVSRDFPALETAVLTMDDLAREYYERVGYAAYSKVIEEVDAILGFDGSMKLPTDLSVSSNWATQSYVLWGIVNEANRSDDIDVDEVMENADVVLEKFEKDIRDIPKMVKWINDFLNKYGA